MICAEHLGGLDFVEGVVAADEQETFPSVADHDHQALHDAIGRDAQVIAHLFDAFPAGRRHLFERLSRCGTRHAGCQRLGQLDVGGVVGVGTEGDRILAGIRQHVKLVRAGAADGTGVGRDRPEAQAEAREDPAVGLVHHPIRLFETRVVDVERVGVLHDELARPHHAEAGADLVAELGLDLVEVERQLAVAADLPARDVGDHLFVRRPEAEVALVPVTDLEHLRAEHVPPAGLLPQLGGLDRRHEQLDGAAAVHFLAYYGFDPAQHPEPERHPGVEPAPEPADEARAQHQGMAREFRLRRGLLQGRDEVLTDAHGLPAREKPLF